MNDFFEKHLSKMLGSAGFLGIFQFVGQLSDYLSDGQLDTHEIQQLFLSTTSAAQTVIIIVVIVVSWKFRCGSLEISYNKKIQNFVCCLITSNIQ